MSGSTFAATDDEILVGSAERTPDNELALLLSHVSFDNLCVVDLDELNLTVRHVDEHML